MTIQDRIILVTGGAKRIGQAISLALGGRGAHVVLTYRTSAREAEHTVRALQQLGTKSFAMKADVTREQDIVRLIARIRSRYGRLDVLVNNAASFERVPYAKLTSQAWDRTIATNLSGPFLCALHASRLMQRHGEGKIINIADWAGIRPYRNYLPYCVAKGGVITLTKALAKELAPAIQVNAVAPGPMLPPPTMTRAERARVATRVPLKRWGSPEDIARTIVFLIEGTDFMTGSIVYVDGGQSIA
jgi:NAD(P)-dependent dehydrogenase (short-subunit alcohol dehydrogenase family)